MILVGEPVVGDRDVTSPQFHQTQSIFFIVGALHTHTHLSFWRPSPKQSSTPLNCRPFRTRDEELFSTLAALTPFSNHNQSPRNMYQRLGGVVGRLKIDRGLGVRASIPGPTRPGCFIDTLMTLSLSLYICIYIYISTHGGPCLGVRC